MQNVIAATPNHMMPREKHRHGSVMDNQLQEQFDITHVFWGDIQHCMTACKTACKTAGRNTMLNRELHPVLKPTAIKNKLSQGCKQVGLA